MGSGRSLTSVAMVLLGLLVTANTAGADRFLVGDERHAGVPSVVHVAVDAPARHAEVQIVVTVEGPAETRELTTAERVGPGVSTHLVALPWTPEEVGEHRLRGEIVVGDEVRTLGEHAVHVAAAPGEAERSLPAEGSLPATAPGTVQWAIAFGFLFFVARAGLDRRP